MNAMEFKLLPGEYYRANHKRFKRLSRALRYAKSYEDGIFTIYIEKFENPKEVCPVNKIALKDIQSLRKYCKMRVVDIIKEGDKIIPIAEYFNIPIICEGEEDCAMVELDLDMLNGNSRFNGNDIIEYHGKKYSVGAMYYYEISDDNTDYTADRILNTELNLDASRIFTNFYWITEVDNPVHNIPCGRAYSRFFKKVN